MCGSHKESVFSEGLEMEKFPSGVFNSAMSLQVQQMSLSIHALTGLEQQAKAKCSADLVLQWPTFLITDTTDDMATGC